MATLLLSVGEEQRALLSPLKSLLRRGGGWSGKKETHSRRDIHCRPCWPFATLGSPIYPRQLYLPKGRRGQGTMVTPLCRSTDAHNGPVGAREAPRARWAKCLATVLGTAGARAPLEVAISEPRVFAYQFQRSGVGWRHRERLARSLTRNPVSVSHGCSQTSSSATTPTRSAFFVVRLRPSSARDVWSDCRFASLQVAHAGSASRPRRHQSRPERLSLLTSASRQKRHVPPSTT
jgi:hypothetical protein